MDSVRVSSIPTTQSAAGYPSKLYVLGPEDQIVIQGINVDELANKPMRIDANGEVNFPLVGIVHAGGLSVRDFEVRLNEKMKAYLRNPQLVVSVTEYRSQPVEVLGAVNTPGVHQLQGEKSLVEVISLAGGLRQDAGSHVTITREIAEGNLLLPGARTDASGRYATAGLNLKEVTSGLNPSENVVIKPHDIISVARAATIYVVGDVKKPGGFLLGENDSISVMQALALAEGAEHTANMSHARIIRGSETNGSRTEITCNIQKIFSGKEEDIGLQPRDILFVPSSTGKKVALCALEMAIQTGSGVAIFSAGR